MNTSTQITEFTHTEAALAILEEKYKTIPDATTKEGYQECVNAIRELRPLRTGLDKMRLKLNADDQARIKWRNTEAKRITNRLVALEDPIKNTKLEVDKRAEREAEALRQAEENRIQNIQDRIGLIKGEAELPLSADVDLITETLDRVRTFTVTEELFQEFTEQAEEVYGETMTKLESVLAERVAFEDQKAEQTRIAAEQEAKQAELDRQAAEQRKQQQAEQARIDAQAAELQRKQDEIDAKLKAEEDRKLAEERAEAERVRQEKERLEQEEADRIRKEEAARLQAEEDARQEALRPEKERLIDWLKKLRFIDGIELHDKNLIAIQQRALNDLAALSEALIKIVEDA